VPAVASAAVAADPYAAARDAARVLAARTGADRHDVLVVLGSGWAGAADAFGETVAELDVTGLPGFLPFVAEGHVGRVRSSVLAGRRVLTFLGRTHLYEGHGAAQVVHAVRTAAAAGCTLAVLTSANGSLRPRWGTGTGVVLRDHLNLSGGAPLVGPRFVDLTDVWTPRWRDRALAADPGLVEGVYAMMRGPEYQPLAETLMLRTLGADVVGMSTVLEAIAAREAGMELLGLSVVTTVEGSGGAIDFEEVVRVAAAAATRLGGVVATVLAAASHEEEAGHVR
jgi:purine-nucleoside phosphorylase